MGWWPFGHVLRGRNPQLWHETASNHLADFGISVCTLARGRVRWASVTFLFVAGRDIALASVPLDQAQ